MFEMFVIRHPQRIRIEVVDALFCHDSLAEVDTQLLI